MVNKKCGRCQLPRLFGVGASSAKCEYEALVGSYWWRKPEVLGNEPGWVSRLLPQDQHWLGLDRSRASRRWDTTARPSLWHYAYQSAECRHLLGVAIGLFRPQNPRRVFGLESSACFSVLLTNFWFSTIRLLRLPCTHASFFLLS